MGISAYPAHPDPAGPGGFATDLGTTWIRAPIVGIAVAFGGELPDLAVDVLRIFLGLSGCVILLAAVSTSISGVGRLAYSLGQHGMLPHAFGRLSKRTLIAPASIATAVLFSSALLLAAVLVSGPVRFLASLYSFGVLIAFTAAQLAVIRLRFTEPELERPFRALINVSVRGTPVPLAALIGAPLTFLIWIAALLTHDAARVAGPIWVVLGFVVFATVRRSRRRDPARARSAGGARSRAGGGRRSSSASWSRSSSARSATRFSPPRSGWPRSKAARCTS